jgi:hypothetical protein
MKKLFVLCVAMAAKEAFAAGVPTIESPIRDYGTPTTVSISTSTLTKVPTSQTSGRIGIFIDAPSTNSGRTVGFFGDCSSTSIATTVRPLEISPGTNTSYLALREDVCLWLLSTHTSAENVHYQEVKQ